MKKMNFAYALLGIMLAVSTPVWSASKKGRVARLERICLRLVQGEKNTYTRMIQAEPLYVHKQIKKRRWRIIQRNYRRALRRFRLFKKRHLALVLRITQLHTPLPLTPSVEPIILQEPEQQTLQESIQNTIREQLENIQQTGLIPSLESPVFQQLLQRIAQQPIPNAIPQEQENVLQRSLVPSVEPIILQEPEQQIVQPPIPNPIPQQNVRQRSRAQEEDDDALEAESIERHFQYSLADFYRRRSLVIIVKFFEGLHRYANSALSTQLYRAFEMRGRSGEPRNDGELKRLLGRVMPNFLQEFQQAEEEDLEKFRQGRESVPQAQQLEWYVVQSEIPGAAVLESVPAIDRFLTHFTFRNFMADLQTNPIPEALVNADGAYLIEDDALCLKDFYVPGVDITPEDFSRAICDLPLEQIFSSHLQTNIVTKVCHEMGRIHNDPARTRRAYIKCALPRYQPFFTNYRPQSSHQNSSYRFLESRLDRTLPLLGYQIKDIPHDPNHNIAVMAFGYDRYLNISDSLEEKVGPGSFVTLALKRIPAQNKEIWQEGLRAHALRYARN
jgi:hypothetical protein